MQTETMNKIIESMDGWHTKELRDVKHNCPIRIHKNPNNYAIENGTMVIMFTSYKFDDACQRLVLFWNEYYIGSVDLRDVEL